MEPIAVEPLVSVLTPSYNSARTLPLAIASMIAQTYENWECVLVDDGSTDATQEVVAAISDPRIKYVRLDRNYGRGFARQVTLDLAQGEFITMVDADDWIYPSKLLRQVDAFRAEPQAAVVGMGMAILNKSNQLAGIRAPAAVVNGRMERLAMPPVPFAPAMIPLGLARQAGFNRRFLLAQDVDFLLRVVLGRSFVSLPDVGYAYTEQNTVTLDKVMRAFAYTRSMFWSHRRAFPVLSVLNVMKAAGKSAVSRAAAAVGQWDYMITRRSRPPSIAQQQDFDSALNEVSLVLLRLSHAVALTSAVEL